MGFTATVAVFLGLSSGLGALGVAAPTWALLAAGGIAFPVGAILTPRWKILAYSGMKPQPALPAVKTSTETEGPFKNTKWID